MLDIAEIVAQALSEVPMRPDQAAAARKIGAEIAPMEAVARSTGNALVLALANQVQAGKLDGHALAPMIQALAVAKESLFVTARSVLERLHVFLDDDQRASFADAFAYDVHVNFSLMTDKKRLDDRLRHLALNEVQKQELHYAHDALVGMMRVGLRDAHRGLDAFRGETISMEAIMARRDILPIVRTRLATAFEVLKGFADILDAGQRGLLAQHLRGLVKARPVAAA